MSGNIFGSLIDSVKEVFSNPQVLAQGVKDGNIARTGNTEYFIDGKDSFHNMKDAEAASGRWQKRAQDELIGLATIGIGKTAQGLYKGAQTANTVNKGNNWTKGLTGTLALGTAVGQGISEPSQKKATPVASRQRPKYAIGKYNQRSYNRLSQLQKVYGGDLIRQKDGSYFLRNKNVTLSTPNSSTTDITNSHNVSTLINNGNYKAPNLGGMTTNYLENRPLDSYSELTKHNFDRGDIRQGMRANGINPYDYSGSDRKQLKTYLNNPTTDNYTQSVSKIIGDGKIQQNMLNNAVQNQTSQYQLTKPNLGYNPSQNNQLVNLKFEKGGQMYKYSAGAQMVQPQQASGQQGIEQQAMTLVQAAMQGDQQANQTIQKIMQAAQQGDQQAAQVAKLLQAIVQQMKGSRKARLGAKLDYIKQSIGECPEGQEVVYFKKGGEICKICAGKKMQDGGKSDPIKNFKKKKDVAKQTYQRNPYTRGKSAKEIAEMQRRNRQEASAGKGENDANVAPWNYKKKKMK